MTERRPRPLELTLLHGDFAICRLDPDAPVPVGIAHAGLVSVTRTREELSILCPEPLAPEGARRESGWRGLAVEGPLPFSATGILASLTGPLAEAGISIFAVSTFDTDYLFVRQTQLERALAALRAAGHSLRE